MSREVVSPGSPFSIAWYDRGFGSVPRDVINVDGADGSVTIGGRELVGTPTVTSTTGAASNTATLQLRDAAGNALAEARRVFFWVSATAGATSVGTDTTGLTTTVTTGVAITAVAGNLSGDALTDATGKLVITLADAAGTTTRFVNFSVDGKTFSSAAVITP
jgi:hypothetical protein